MRFAKACLAAAVFSAGCSGATAVSATPRAASPTPPSTMVSDLRVEAAHAPIGLDTPQPSIEWSLADLRPGAAQTAYQVQVGSFANGADVWDSGKVASPWPRALYAGRALHARERLYVRVRTWDIGGRPSKWSAPSHWEMGLLDGTDWKADWIGAAGVNSVRASYAGHDFRRTFTLPSRPVSARLYIAGTGLLQNCLDRRTPQACRVAASLVVPTINGAALSDRQLDPAPTDAKRPLYTALDVTRFLRGGANTIGVRVAGDTSFIAQLEVRFADGNQRVIVSDSAWRTQTNGYLHVDRFAGETYDARRDATGWDTPGFTLRPTWVPAEVRTTAVGNVALTSDATLPPMRIVKRWKPVTVTQNAPGRYTLDFGQNITGRLHIRLPGQLGQTLVITHAESLDRRSEADRFATGFFGLQTDRYTFGAQSADWAAPFSYYGFRYVTVSGLKAAPTVGQVWAEQVNTDLQRTGSFESSSPLLNRVHRAAVQTTLNNAHGIPEDCPHREKRGWSQDAYVSDPQAFANFDMEGFYAKWLRDAQDAQRPDGAGTDIAPAEVSYAVDGDSTWASALVFMPWDLYRQTGDIRYLQGSYDSMRRLVEWEVSQAKDGLLPPGIYVGDWVAAKQTDDGLLRNALWYATVKQVRDAAVQLDKSEDAERYGRLAEAIRTRFNASFLDRVTATYGAPGSQNTSTSQASLAVPLAVGIVPDELLQAVAARLARYVAEVSQGHVESGLTATRFVLEGLAATDRSDLIHEMLSQRDAPGWDDMVERGPGTLWENWRGGSSHDHAWPGVIDAWLYRMYGGIQATAPGYRTLSIKPFIPTDVSWVKASQATPFGQVASAWRKNDGRLTLEVEVPPGTTATIMVPTHGSAARAEPSCRDCGAPNAESTALPGYSAFKVPSGHYRFASAGW